MLTLNFEAALETASEGKVTLREIADALGCTPRQLRLIRQNNPEFDKTLHQAREDGFMGLADKLLTIFEDNPGADPHEIRVRSENIKWYLGKLYARVFGDKIDISITERVDIRLAITESRARLKVINPGLLSTDPFE